MADNNYIGANGLVTQDLQSIIDDLTEQYKAIYGSDINVEQNSPDGQLINIAAQQKKDTLDRFTTLYNNLDPDRVIGIPQQILYKLNGLFIKAYTYSYLIVNITTSTDVSLQGLDDNIDNADGTGYTVKDSNGTRWILVSSTNLSAGTHALNFRAADLGAITSLPNTVNIMETVLAGVTSVNNPAVNYIIGNTGESASEFRTRRNKSLALPSQGFDESIESQMLSLSNVTQCKVYDNRTNQEVDGIPAHTAWVIVEGGTPEEVGKVIYANLPPGIPMKGKQIIVITKSNGALERIYYDLPTAVTLYMKATIKNFTTSPLDLEYYKQQLVQNTHFSISERVEQSLLTGNLTELVGESGTIYDVALSIDGQNWVEYITPTGLDEFFTLTTESITLTVE